MKRRWIAWLAAALTLSLLVTLAVVASGYDARDTPREEAGVWVTRSAGQYARVNTLTGEIDAVRQVENPSGVVQAGALSLLLTQGNARAWPIDPTNPADVGLPAGDPALADSAGADGIAGDPAASDTDAANEAVTTETAGSDARGDSIRTPDGTREVYASDAAVVFRTADGQVYLAAVDPTAEGGLTPAQLLDPHNGEQEFRADALAFDTESGVIAMFSAAEHAVYWFDTGVGTFRRGASTVPEQAPGDSVQLAIVADDWHLFDPATGTLWRERGAAPIRLDTTGRALLQMSGAEQAASTVLVADEAGLWAIDAAGTSERIAEATGVPARPMLVGQERSAAWISQGGAQLWTSGAGVTPLALDPTVELPGEIEPVIHSNGSHAVVAETRTGMLWRIPDGQLIPVAQWQQISPPQQQVGMRSTEDVAEQQPPVAMPDSFGVRAGEPTQLPVLLNDFDPNRRDVLTIVPESIGEDGSTLDTDFGTVAVLEDAQTLTVSPSAAATGAASFTYRVTDGQEVSAPATVRLSVVSDDVNTAPQWCAVEGCQRAWPSPELTPGGTLVLPLLEGWVDPEGDPVVLVDAVSQSPDAPLRALVTADGKLAVRHTDPAAADGEWVVRVGVADARGARTERELRILVRGGAAMQFTAMARTVRVGEAAAVRPLDRMSGGSGAFALLDATVQQGAAQVTVQQGPGTVTVTASSAGGTLLGVTVRDTVTGQELLGVIRITAVEQRAALAVPPLRGFVRPLADATVEVLEAIPGAAGRGLAVQSAVVVDGRLRTDVLEHARVRVAGSTADGLPGRIGAAEVVVTEGESSARTRLTVFQVAETAGEVIAVPDTATVRAGSVVDIPVLENDVAAPGERLVLHPEVTGMERSLAFASGTQVRVLAPNTPGTFTLSYTTYGASSPDRADTAQITLTVLPTDGNREPQPQAVTVRLNPGETVTTPVPLSGVDPDGDRVRLVAVAAPEDPQVVVSVQPRTGVIEVSAAASAALGTRVAEYTVRDGAGSEGSARLRIIVTEPDTNSGAPIVYTDYVRIAQGVREAVTVRPLDNDVDPANGALDIVSVVPNVPGGADTAAYAELASRLDLAGLKQGVVRITAGSTLGTVSYRYTVRSTASNSTAEGLIVVQVSERVGVQAPRIIDTVLTVRDRADLASVGVDVVEGRVRWATGDVSTLQLSVWGEAAERYRVSGNRIIGEYLAGGDLVPFRLAGVDASGAAVESFGFLVVPPLDELRLSLRAGAAPLTVNEGASAEVDLREILDLAAADQIVVAAGPFPTQRPQASCELIANTTVRYSAGQGEPWVDTCIVQVRLAEQTRTTALPVPVRIVPREPVATLKPLTRTLAPGASETIALGTLVEWQGGRQGQMSALRFTIDGSTSAFVLSPAGASLTLQARAGATPGTQEQVTVRVSGAGNSDTLLTLRVGEAPIDVPRGAAVALSCTVGDACATTLVGQSGEYDPFAGTPGGGLRLVDIDAGACAVASFRAEDDTVRVSWAAERVAGGTCELSFRVRDAQNREGTGTLSFEALGVPPAPAAIEQIGFSDTSVTLRVTLGAAQTAYPALEALVLSQDGAPIAANCVLAAASATCQVDGLTAGTEHRFTARATNAIGESANSPETTAWAYRAPAAPNFTAEQTGAELTGTTGTVRVRITGGADVQEYLLLVNGALLQTLVPSGGSNAVDAEVTVPVGEHRLQAVPVSRFPHPLREANTGQAAEQMLTVAGPPRILDLVLATDPGATTVRATVDLSSNFGQGTLWGITTTGVCVPDTPGMPTGPIELIGIAGDTMVVTVCASNTDWGDAQPVTRQIVVGGT